MAADGYLLASPGHQQQWYWQPMIGKSFTTIRKDSTDSRQFSVRKWRNIHMISSCFLNNLPFKVITTGQWIRLNNAQLLSFKTINHSIRCMASCKSISIACYRGGTCQSMGSHPVHLQYIRDAMSTTYDEWVDFHGVHSTQKDLWSITIWYVYNQIIVVYEFCIYMEEQSYNITIQSKPLWDFVLTRL